METVLVKISGGRPCPEPSLNPAGRGTHAFRQHGRSRPGARAPARRLRPHAAGVRGRGSRPRRPGRDRARRPQGADQRHQGVPRHQLRRPGRDLPRAVQEREPRSLADRPRRGDRLLRQGGRQPAGSRPPQGPAARQPVAGARRQGRLLRRDLRGRQPPHPGAARRHSAGGAARLRGGRGQALLRPPRHRRARPGARLRGQHDAAGPPAGRLDHHPAGGEEPAGRRRRHLRAQDPRDHRDVAAGADAHQAGDPRALSQLDLLRPQFVGRRAGGAQLVRQVDQGGVARRGRDARRPGQGSQLLQPGAGARPRARAARLRARPHAGGRRHHGRRGQGAGRLAGGRPAAAGAQRGGAEFLRLPQPRGEDAARPRAARQRDLHDPLDHLSRPAGRDRGRAAGRAGAVRDQRGPGRLPGTGSEPVGRDPADRRRCAAPRRRPRRRRRSPTGSRRSPPRICRCATCTGRRRW